MIRKSLRVFAFLCVLFLAWPALAQLREPSPLPEGLPSAAAARLGGLRAELVAQLEELGKQLDAHNQNCSQVAETDTSLIASCQQSQAAVGKGMKAYKKAVAAYEKDLSAAPSCKPSQEASVVDLCGKSGVVEPHVMPWGSGLPRVEEIERSPAAATAREAFEAVVAHNWPLALNLWQEAFEQDPGNASLKRSVMLGQWMVDWHVKQADSIHILQPAVDAASRGDQATLRKELSQVRKDNPQVQVPKESDIEFLFDLQKISQVKDPGVRRAELASLRNTLPGIQAPTDDDLELMFPEVTDADKRAVAKMDEKYFSPSRNTAQQQKFFERSLSEQLYEKALFHLLAGENEAYNSTIKAAARAYRNEETGAGNGKRAQ